MRVRLGFSRSSTLVSRIIQWVTGGDVSHAFFLLEDEALGSLVYQSASNGPELVTKSVFEQGHQVLHVVEPLADLSEAVRESIKKYVGYSYDWGADLSIGLNEAAKAAGLKLRVDLAQDHASECAALVVRTLLLAVPAYPGVGNLDPQLETPASLLRFAQGKGFPPSS